MRKEVAYLLIVSKALSERELEVFRLVCCSNGEIGQRLGIRVATVKNHFNAILQKLGATNRNEAIVHALQADIIDLYDIEPPRALRPVHGGLAWEHTGNKIVIVESYDSL